MSKSLSALSLGSRDFAAIGAHKASHWAEAKARRGAGIALLAGEALREQVRLVKPSYPSADERALDHACHLRLMDALGRVVSRDG